MLRFLCAAAAAFAFSSGAMASDLDVTKMTLEQLRAHYEEGVTPAMDRYDEWIACQRVCIDVSTDCNIQGGTGCNQYYADCMERCNTLYRD